VPYTLLAPLIPPSLLALEQPSPLARFNFANLSTRRKHMNEHLLPFKCNFSNCPRSFARYPDLSRHESAVHRQENNFFCPVSGCRRSRFGFARKDHLKQHSQTHEKYAMNSLPPFIEAGESSNAKEDTRIDAEDVQVEFPPRKRRRKVAEESQSAQQVTSASSEIERLQDLVVELRDENKRLQAQVEKQTDIIQTLVMRSSGNS
jgi:uncharacterized Zn-finger protein